MVPGNWNGLPRKPKLISEARPPRAQFSAPSRETLVLPQGAHMEKPHTHQTAGREARSATPGAGVIPSFRLKFVNQTADELHIIVLAAGRGLVDKVVLQGNLEAEFF